MHDMLVKLYDLPDSSPYLVRLAAEGIDIRRALAVEKHLIVEWVSAHWSAAWASECDVAFANHPVSCYIAVDAASQDVVGFACYDATYRNFFGPTGVLPAYRGRDIGAALLLVCLHAMHAQGFAYAIIGGVGPSAFYARVAGAVDIEGSAPGIYRGVNWQRVGLLPSEGQR